LIAVLTGLGTFAAMQAGAYVITFMPPAWASCISSAVMAGAGFWIILQSRSGAVTGDLPVEPGGQKDLRQPPAEREYVQLATFEIKFLGMLIRILKEPVAGDRDASGTIDFKEACIVGMALSLNNLAGGLGGGMAGLNPFYTALLALAISILFFISGLKVGQRYLSRWIGERSAVIAGLLLVIIAVYELVI